VDEVVWEGLNIEEMPSLQVVVQINTLKFLYAESDELWSVRQHMNESFGKKYPAEFGPSDLNYYVDSPDELALINYTSGTSGFSKGVMVPYRALLSNLEFGFQLFPDLHAGESVVSMLPLATQKGMDKAALEAHLTSLLPAINRELPNYSQKFEFMPEDFERTPKRSIKRYIYQRK